ncbi:hypothetical protein PTTG_26407 [Puccinia triticina 1-1 BBBD Race 1]|uniref:CCHC-type domain-containing protein n=1 Tax=Puccinia triticina (isolate 1-1 / race 1 (BBBD)) TaxID=630390 RepID=A0A180GTQ0_PUCT1|nr:hypothetical protein PTTG_26407 [Puccinia triticina 1-1 BBBD Race 1]
MDPRLPSKPARHPREANIPVSTPAAAMGQQERLDAKLAKQICDFEEAKFLLKQSKLVGVAIQTGKVQFRQVNTLKADGANFANWYRNLAEVGRAAVDDTRLFTTACENSTYEKIARALLISSVDQLLVAKMQQLPTCFAMYTALFDKFKTSSRAAQMLIYYKFRRFKINPDGHNAGIALTLQDLQAEWAAVNVKFGMDAFMGFVLQSAVMESEAEYKKAFELRVEQLVQDDKQGHCPSFNLIMKALDICKDQHKHTVELLSDAGPGFTSKAPPAALSTSPLAINNFDVSAFLADVDEQDWVDALEFHALTAHKCWQCGGKNHYARNCPEPQQSNPSNKRLGTPMGTIVGTIYGHLPSGALVSSSRFPRTNFKRSQFPPSRNQQHAKNLADFYRPRYQGNSQQSQQADAGPSIPARKGVEAHIVEVNGLPDDLDDLDFHSMALGEDLLPVGQDLQSQAWEP